MATAPLFNEYLNYVLPEESKRTVLCEYLGYLFTKNLKLEKVLFAYGTGANGKSVLTDVITGMLGKENVSNVSLMELTTVEGKGRARIADKIVNYLSETGPKLEAPIFKQLASGETVSAKRLYRDEYEINNYAKFIFNMNELPRDVEQTNGFFRRLIIILFGVTVPEDKRDPDLPKKIIENELPGVLNWVLSGLNRIVTNKAFSKSDEITKEVELYRTNSNPVALWIEENGYEKSEIDFIKLTNLYSEFTSYCLIRGHKFVPNIITLGIRLKALGFKSEKKRDGKVIYISKV